MWFTPEGLSIITTHQCTAACDHCCFACSPGVHKAIPVPRLRALIEETREVPSLVQVIFTGGECFLLGHELDRLVGRCRQLGLSTRCVTNGYWATSLQAARSRVQDLHAAGLDELNFSTGTHHARFVPWERVAWGATAAAEAGIREVAINVETFAGSGFDPAWLTGHALVQPHLEAGRVRILQGVWIPNGGEWGDGSGRCCLGHEPDCLRFRDGGGSACDTSLRVVSVTPDLDLVTCCGLNMEHIPQLHVANLAGQTLGQALERIPPDLLKIWIHVEGPERVLEFVRAKCPGFPLPLESAHMCHTCQYLHQSPEALEVLARSQQEVEARILEQFLLATAGRAMAYAL